MDNYYPVINDYVTIRTDSKFYKKYKRIIYRITSWNSEEYFLTDFDGNKLKVNWGDARFLKGKELKKLDFLEDVKKYNL